MSWGSLKMPFGLVSRGSISLRPTGAPSNLMVIVYLPLSRGIVRDVRLQKLRGRRLWGEFAATWRKGAGIYTTSSAARSVEE